MQYVCFVWMREKVSSYIWLEFVFVMMCWYRVYWCYWVYELNIIEYMAANKYAREYSKSPSKVELGKAKISADHWKTTS